MSLCTVKIDGNSEFQAKVSMMRDPQACLLLVMDYDEAEECRVLKLTNKVEKVFSPRDTIKIRFTGNKSTVILSEFRYQKGYDHLLRNLTRVSKKDYQELVHEVQPYKPKFDTGSELNAMQMAHLTSTVHKTPQLQIIQDKFEPETPSLAAKLAHSIQSSEHFYGPTLQGPMVQSNPLYKNRQHVYGKPTKDRPWTMSVPVVKPQDRFNKQIAPFHPSPDTTKRKFYNMSDNPSTLLWSDKRFRDENSVPSSSQIKREGFRNSGNNCYINATLQALMNLPSFVAAIVAVKDPIPLVQSMQDILMMKKQNTVVDPAALKACIAAVDSRFSLDDQQDADEFLRQVLDMLEQENSVSKLFKFEVSHKVACISCNNESVSTEHYRDIPLFIPTGDVFTLEGLLAEFFKDQVVDYKCEECDGQQSRIETKLNKAPQILILQVKRFDIDTATYRSSKRTEKVTLNALVQLQDVQFKMQSIISHIGLSPSSGHYVCDVKQQDKWNCYDDSRLKEIGDFTKVEKLRSNCAYLLFLEKE